MESHRKGDLTEALVVAELKRREIPVSKPVGDNERYDLVAESAGGLWKLQVKTGWLKDGTIRFHGKSQHTNAAGNVYELYDGDVDFFVVYVDELEELYLVEESSVRSNMRLRVDKPDQYDRSINWADAFEFDRNWPPGDATARPPESDQPFVERLEEHDVPTYLPRVGDPPFDAIVATSDGDLHSVQFEPGWVVGGRIRFNGGEAGNEDGQDLAVDYVLIFCAELDRLYLVDRGCFDVTISLRVEEPIQPNSRINWAEDYEFASNWPP